MKLILSAVLAMTALIGAPVYAQVSEETHNRCLKAVDYAGCVGVKNNQAEEQIKTGILWDTAEWTGNIVKLKVYRMRGGGLWVGNAMRLSQMMVNCSTARFDVQSDGYGEQALEGDASRQAPLIFSRLCTKARTSTPVAP
jgi:hypothetical protein